MLFTFNFLTLFFILITAALVCMALAVAVGMSPFIRVGAVPDLPADTPSEDSETETEDSADKYPSLTVIVYSFCRRDELEKYMESLMSQDYPNFKVVLIVDASAAATSEISEYFVEKYTGRFYATFVPPESRNLSRRKLAITLGMKACDTQYVLSTVSNIDIPGPHWLSSMIKPVIEDHANTEIVLGYSHPDFSEFKGFGKRYKQFDDVCTACQWLGAALKGRPYRGDGYNLLLRRDLFFEQKGFSKTINLHAGDDDLFVNTIADGGNTAVMINSDAILTTLWGDAANRIHTDRKERYDFTSRWLPKAPFLKAGLLSALQWIVPACIVAAIYVEAPNLASLCIAIPLLLLFWIGETIIYRKAAKRIHSTALCFSLPLFLFWHPVANFMFRIKHRRNRIKNFTWQRRKH